MGALGGVGVPFISRLYKFFLLKIRRLTWKEGSADFYAKKV
jgi:hypothetical protein